MSDKSILENYKYVILDQKDKRFHFIDDDVMLNIWREDGSIKDQDVVITLTKENIKVAKLIQKIVI